MGIRGYKVRRIWPSAIVITLACMLTIPLATGQIHDGDDGGAIDRPSAPDPIPVLSLSLSPTQLEAEVTADQLGAVTFGGTVTVEQLRIMSSTVTLQAVVSTGWPVVISPTTFEFTGSGSEEFILTIIVPPATNAMITGNVIVSGTLTAPLLSPVVASAGAVVTIATYYDIYIESDDRFVQLSPGDSGEVILQIWNRGNGIATVSTTVVTEAQDVRFELSEDKLVIDPNTFENLTVKILTTKSTPRGGHNVHIYLNIAEVEPLNGDYGSILTVSLRINTMAEIIGYGVIVVLVVLACFGVAVVVLWKKGKLSKLKEIKLPKRTKAEG